MSGQACLFCCVFFRLAFNERAFVRSFRYRSESRGLELDIGERMYSSHPPTVVLRKTAAWTVRRFKPFGERKTLTSSSSEEMSSILVARSAPGDRASLFNLSCSNRSVHLEHLFVGFVTEASYWSAHAGRALRATSMLFQRTAVDGSSFEQACSEKSYSQSLRLGN